MGRHGYCDDVSEQQAALWRGRVASAIRGKRGQRLLRDMRDALNALPDKRLITGELQTAEGECCAIGAVGFHRDIDMTGVNVCEELHHMMLAGTFDVAECLIAEIEYENDEGGPWKETPEQRHGRMLAWVEKHIKAEVVS